MLRMWDPAVPANSWHSHSKALQPAQSHPTDNKLDTQGAKGMSACTATGAGIAGEQSDAPAAGPPAAECPGQLQHRHRPRHQRQRQRNGAAPGNARVACQAHADGHQVPLSIHDDLQKVASLGNLGCAFLWRTAIAATLFTSQSCFKGFVHHSLLKCRDGEPPCSCGR